MSPAVNPPRTPAMTAGAPRLREDAPGYDFQRDAQRDVQPDTQPDAASGLAPGAPPGSPALPAEETLTALWLLSRLPEAAIPGVLAQRLLRPGRAGRGPGPDVREASLLLPSGAPRAGDVEVHVRASDWFRHGHHRDPAYGGVILHLAWIEDRPAGGQGVTGERPEAPGSRDPRLGLPVPLAGGGQAPTLLVGPALRHDAARLERLVAQGPAGPSVPCAGARGRLGAAALTEAVRLEGRRRLAERAWRAARLVERYGWAGAGERLLERALAATAGRRREPEEARALHLAVIAARLGADPVAGLMAAIEADPPAPRDLAGPFRLEGMHPIGPARALEIAWNAALPLLIAAAAAYADVALARRTADLAARWPAPRPYGRTRSLAASLGPAPHRPAGGGALYAQGLLHLQDLWCSRGGCGVCPLS